VHLLAHYIQGICKLQLQSQFTYKKTNFYTDAEDKFVPDHIAREYWGTLFLNPAVNVGKWTASRLSRFIPANN
jgi:hypothetical protein